MPRLGIKRSASLYVKSSSSGSDENSENRAPGTPSNAKKTGLETGAGGGSKRLALGLNASVLNLSINDCTCPICLEILVEPVQMPCHHEVCLPCFKAMTDKTNFHCPMCRMRISTWSRAASNSNTLVNQQRWEQIKRAFPQEIRDRVEGKTAQILAESIKKDKENAQQHAHVQQQQQHHHQPVAEPGAIRREYEEYLRREQERIRAEQETEEKLSLDLIQRVLREEDAVSLDDYVRMVERTAGPSTTSADRHPPPATRSVDHQHHHHQQRPVQPIHPPPPPPANPPTEPAEQAPPVPPRPARIRIPRIGDLIGEERGGSGSATPSTPSQAADEVSNIKLRLRPSIKRTRDIVRPVVVRKAMEEAAAADSSLDMSSASAADTTTTASDRRLRGATSRPTAAETSRAEEPAETTPALPKRRMSLRRSTRV